MTIASSPSKATAFDQVGIAQDSSTAHMIWNPFELVSYVSHQMTLLPGDVIATGAPAGAQVVHAGDRVEIEIEGIGSLANPVVRA